MIPSAQKVNSDLFKLLMGRGRGFNSESFSLKVFFTGGSLKPKFSVVVSKKLEKSAVGRNKIKRRIYSLLRSHLKTAKPGSISVLFLKKKVGRDILFPLNLEIDTLLRKAGVTI